MTKTLAQQLAIEADAFSFDELPDEVVRQAKRVMLDTIGLGLRGSRSEPSLIVRELVREVAAPGESTIFGTELRTSCMYASLANGVMVRETEAMDSCRLTPEGRVSVGHLSECVPSILAVGERQHSSGREVVAAIALAYELMARLSASVGGNEGILDRRGWAPETSKVPCMMALVLGRLLGLDVDQLAHALAVSGAFTVAIGVLHAGEEEVTMARNLRFPLGAYNAIQGALLASKGFTGPLTLFEGHHGINHTLAGGEMDLAKLVDSSREWYILNTTFKTFSANSRIHGHIEATLDLVEKHDIKPEDVAEVRIKSTARVRRQMANPETRRHPKNRFTADHSSFYTTAVAILDREVGPDQFSPDRLNDPKIRELSDRVFVEHDPELDKYHDAGVVDITMKSGETYHGEVLYPKGHAGNPVTDADLERKFLGMASNVMDDVRMQQVIETVSAAEDLVDIGELVRLLAASRAR